LEEFDTQFSEIYIDEEDVDVDDYILNKCNARIKSFIKSSLEEILMSMPLEEKRGEGGGIEYPYYLVFSEQRIKKWRNNILK